MTLDDFLTVLSGFLIGYGLNMAFGIGATIAFLGYIIFRYAKADQ